VSSPLIIYSFGGAAHPPLLYRGKGALLRVCKAQGICSAEKEQESNLDLVYKI